MMEPDTRGERQAADLAVDDLDGAAGRLIEALDDMQSIVGFIDGLERTVAATEAVAVVRCPETDEAAALAPVWRSLIDLAVGVQTRREGRQHG